MNGVRRGQRRARTTVPAKDGRRAGICGTVTAPHRHPTSVGSRTSPTAGPGPVRLRRLRRRRVRPADRGLACRHHQSHRRGPDTTADRVVGLGPAKGSRSSRVSCCTTPMPGASTHPSGSSAPRAGGHRSLDRHRGRCLPQRPDGIDHRTVQDRGDRHDRLPRWNLRHPARPGPSDPRHQRRHRRTPPPTRPSNPSRDYQPIGVPKGASCKTPKRTTPGPAFAGPGVADS
jgi:hypothetical protein